MATNIEAPPDGVEPPRRIALVVIHGVGNQQPGESARAAANLLLTFPNQTAAYTGFDDCCGVRIGVQPVEVRPSEEDPRPPGWFEERPRAILRLQQRPRAYTEAERKSARHARQSATAEATTAQQAVVQAHAHAAALHAEAFRLAEQGGDAGTALLRAMTAGDQAKAAGAAAFEALRRAHAAREQEASLYYDHAFMRAALGAPQVTGSDSTYQSVRLTGWRPATPATPTTLAVAAREVHILEMYWADLSRLVPGLFRFLSELFLLMFFVPQLGRKGVDACLVNDPGNVWWRTLRFCLAWSERFFVRFISVLNLYLLAIVALLVPLNLNENSHPLIAVGVTAVLVMVGAFYLLRHIAFPPQWWPTAFLAGTLAAAILAWLVYAFASATWMAVVVSWLAALWISLRLLWAFQQRQRGVFGVAVVAGLTVTGMLFCLLPWRGQIKEYIDAGLWTAEYVWAGLAALWVLFGLTSLVTGVAACLALLFAGDRPHAWRVVWTAAVSLTVPPMLFLILTLAHWRALFQAGQSWLPDQGHALSWPMRLLLNDPPANVRGMIDRLIVDSAPPVYYLGFGVFIYLMVMVSWSLIPAVLSESTRRDQVNAGASRWLGLSLSAGFRGLIVALPLVGFLFLFGSPLIFSAKFLVKEWDWLNEPLKPYRAMILYVLALGILAVVTAKGRLRFLAPVLGTVLDVVLDVANWLRHLPVGRNPPSRICARYVSLLRYLCAWKDPHDQRGYDAIILLAHSQGCVITADLLRFLKAEGYDPALARLTAPCDPVLGPARGLRIHLFTMGNPLRQLYSWPLPDWYGWARDDRPTNLALPTDLRSDEKPEPDELLGVTRWVNAYRSGDFIGRHIWRADSRGYLFELSATVSRDAAGTREEFCIGNGAHTHYWDDTAPEIAVRLDQLIAEA